METIDVYSNMFDAGLYGVVEVFGPDAFCLRMIRPFPNLYWEEYFGMSQKPLENWRDAIIGRATWCLNSLYDQYCRVRENLQEYKDLYEEYRHYVARISERYSQIPDDISSHFREFYLSALDHDMEEGFNRVIRERYTAAGEPWKVMTIDSICMYLNAIEDEKRNR